MSASPAPTRCRSIFRRNRTPTRSCKLTLPVPPGSAPRFRGVRAHRVAIAPARGPLQVDRVSRLGGATCDWARIKRRMVEGEGANRSVFEKSPARSRQLADGQPQPPSPVLSTKQLRPSRQRLASALPFHIPPERHNPICLYSYSAKRSSARRRLAYIGDVDIPLLPLSPSGW
jgi:hypothetical protein